MCKKEWCVSTVGRDYQFAALSKQAQLTWVSAIEAQIQQAAAAMVAPVEQKIVVGRTGEQGHLNTIDRVELS